MTEWNAMSAVPARPPAPPANAAQPAECLHRLFAGQAASRPDALAVTSEDEGWSYGELDRRANRIAHWLLASGVRPGEIVGVCLPRSPGLVAALLGILKAGCAYLPLDPSYPAERLSFILGDSGARRVVTEARLADSLGIDGPGASADGSGASTDGGASASGVQAAPAGIRPLILCLDRDAGRLGRQLESEPRVQSDPALPAYVIYTSGSTGRPKGVVVTHANVARLLAATDPWFGFGPEDVWTLFHSYAFDFSVWELWGALAYGGRLVVVPYWVSRSPEAFYRLLRQQRVTVLNQTPSAFRQLVWAEGEELAGARPDLDLRRVIFGGEALDPTSLAPWYARRPEPGDDRQPRRPLLVNMYGITETTVHVTYRPLTRADAGSGRSVVGRPIPDLTLYVLEPWGGWEPMPVGVPGEICVGGAGLALGYLGRPELTAERFVPDPYGAAVGARADLGAALGARPADPGAALGARLADPGAAPGARLYRSGDLARRLPDGDIEYLGRIDQQVKVRGFRIELGEIEAALAAYAGVREAAVALRQDPPAGERLVAYVVPEAGAEIHLAELRAHLVARLPEYMLPAAIVLLPALPLTAHGKLDRRALPAPERDAAAAAYAPPCTEAERLLAGLWAELLGVERVGRDDSFFELGGHSLLATRLFARLRRTLGMDLPLAALFEEPTLSQFAARVEAALPGLGLAGLGSEFNAPFNAAARAAGEPVEPSFYGAAERVPDPAGDFPLAYNQRALWFIERLAPGNAAYHIAGIARLLGPVDTAALYRALAALVDRHPALRTTFHDAEDGPLQRVCPQPEPAFDFRDERDENAATGDEDALAARLREEVRRPFDLERGPLLRLALFRQAGGERILLLAVHHLVADFFSLGVMLRDLGALYAAEVTGQPARLAWPAATYEQKVRREQALLAGPDGERLWEHWRDRLAGCPSRSSCPSTAPGPECRPTAAPPGASGSARIQAPPSPASPRRAAPRRSWPCSPCSRPCSAAGAASATSPSACPPPDATAAARRT